MKNQIKPVAAAVGAVFAGALSAADLANAAGNPFAADQLAGGYMQLAEAEGKCGEGKCGGDKEIEGKCGEGKCGEGKCGDDKEAEGKCGEGKCGG